MLSITKCIMTQLNSPKNIDRPSKHTHQTKTYEKVPASQKIVNLKMEIKPVLFKWFLHYRKCHKQKEVTSHRGLFSPCFNMGLKWFSQKPCERSPGIVGFVLAQAVMFQSYRTEEVWTLQTEGGSQLQSQPETHLFRQGKNSTGV